MKRNILILTIVFLLVGYPVFSSHAILDAIALFKELQNFKTAEKGTNENISTYTNISKILVNYRDFHSNEHPSNIINSFIGKKIKMHIFGLYLVSITLSKIIILIIQVINHLAVLYIHLII